jgi:hypothetical protein
MGIMGSTTKVKSIDYLSYWDHLLNTWKVNFKTSAGIWKRSITKQMIFEKLILLNNWFLKKITEQKITKQKITKEMIFENITEQMIFWKYALNDRKKY